MMASPLGDFTLGEHVERLDGGSLLSASTDVYALAGASAARNAYGFTGLGQTVAVIDSGIAYTHAALGGGFGASYRVVGGWDFSNENDGNPYDDGPYGAHGTHVAGIIGAADANYGGVAPGVDLVALRVFNDAGTGYFTWVESALRWVHDHRRDFENPITTVNLSLGSVWNSTTAPAWSTLEDELALLEADGIFISVAAGNDFASYNTAGLSYPAASSHVVPVSSVDNGGGLSSFSQRHQRAIAAPGRSVMSTVPDYLGNRNGADDDFARFSGTSMAAPYVAGASVLVREAFAFIGEANISQSRVYNLMRQTADTVYDAVTRQNYLRLNLDRALATIMPADDFGSTVETAHQLGALGDGAQISGMLGRLDDLDVFAFTARENGTATFTVSSESGVLPVWELVGGGAVSGTGGETLSFRVVAGQSYTLALGGQGKIGRYTIDVEVQSPYVDWGAVSFSQLSDVAISAGSRFAITATRSGTLTIEAFFDRALAQVDFKLYDSFGRLVATSGAVRGGERLDALVSAGETYYLHAGGTSALVDFRLANLVTAHDGRLEVFGTEGNDTFDFAAGPVHRVTINGVLYELAGSNFSSVFFVGGAGVDVARLVGTTGNDRARVDVLAATLSGTSYEVRVSQVETISVDGGLGGVDEALLLDSPGDEWLVVSPTSARLTGAGFANSVRNFDVIRAQASAGNDRAVLYDSRGNDLFFARPGYATLSGSGFSNYVKGFDSVRAYAGAGSDVAVFYDSSGDDQFFATPDFAQLSGAAFLNYARGFDSVRAYATTGYDRTVMHDSAGDDLLTISAGVVELRGQHYRFFAQGFDRTETKATTGNDRAILHDSAIDDWLAASAGGVRFYNSQVDHWVQEFDWIAAYATAGGRNVAQVATADRIFQLHGDWTLVP